MSEYEVSLRVRLSATTALDVATQVQSWLDDIEETAPTYLGFVGMDIFRLEVNEERTP